MKITVEPVMPVVPPKRVILELTEDEAIALAAIMGDTNKLGAIKTVHNTYFTSCTDRRIKERANQMDSVSISNVVGLYYDIPKLLGYNS